MTVENGVFILIFLPFFEKYSNLLYTCIIMMVIDYLTGVLCSVKTKVFSWEIAFDGFCRKLATLAVIVIIAIADCVMPLLFEELIEKFEFIGVIWPTVTASYTFHDICSALLNVDCFGNGVLPNDFRKFLKFFVPDRINKSSTST